MQKIITYFETKGQNVIDALLVFVLGWYGVKLLIYIIKRMMKRSGVDPIVTSFVQSILEVGLKLIVIVTALAQLGVETSSLVTVLATAGAAIVLGLKDSISGVVSGMIILFTKPFVKGDILEVNGYIGKIKEIQLLYTILISFDNKMVVIPNNELASSTFVNYSHEEKRRVDLNFDIHYENDVKKAKELIQSVIEKHPYTLKDEEIYVRVSEYKESAITLSLRVWTLTEHYFDLKDDLIEEVKAIIFVFRIVRLIFILRNIVKVFLFLCLFKKRK